MLEIILLFVMCKNIGRIVAAKGRRKLPFQLMVIVFWFGGEFVGGIGGAIGGTIITGGQDAPFLLVYLFAIVGAAVGAVVAFQIAKALPPLAAYAEPMGDYDQHWQEGAENPAARQPRDRDNTGVVREPRPGDERFSE